MCPACVCCCSPPKKNREKLYQAALAVLPIDQLPTEERTVAAAHVDGRDLPKAGALCSGDLLLGAVNLGVVMPRGCL